MTNLEPTTPLAPLDFNTLDFSNSVAVIRCANRFILPVPDLGDGGELLVYPPASPRAGEPIKEDSPDARGVVFFNNAGQGWEGVRGDGLSTIVINDVNLVQADRLIEIIRDRSTDVGALSVADIKAILSFAADGLGLKDLYPKKKSHIEKDLSTVAEWQGNLSSPDLFFGVLRVLDRVPSQAIFHEQPFRTLEPSDQTHANGGFLLLNQKGRRWPVETRAFVSTYRYADGSDITSVDEFISRASTQEG